MTREPCWACKCGEYDDCECPPDCDCEVCQEYKDLEKDGPITLVDGGNKMPIKPGTLCDNCHKRPATITWIGEGSTTDIIHGGGVPWCDICATRAQLEWCKKQVKRIPKLEKKLKKLLSKE